AAARLEIAGEAIEERRPVFAAQCFDHLDADDGVELARSLAIVLLQELDVGLMRPGPGQLLVRQADRGNLAAARREVAGQRAPAAADLKQGFWIIQPLRQPLPLAPLGGFEPVFGEAIS